MNLTKNLITSQRDLERRLRALFVSRDALELLQVEQALTAQDGLVSEGLSALLSFVQLICKQSILTETEIGRLRSNMEYFRVMGDVWTSGYVALMAANKCAQSQKYETALSLGYCARDRFHEAHDGYWEMKALQNIGSYLAATSKFSEALAYLERTLQLAIVYDSALAEVQAHVNLGSNYCWLGNQPQSLYHYRRAIDILERRPAQEFYELYPAFGSTLRVDTNAEQYGNIYASAHINFSGILQEMSAPTAMVATLLQSAQEMYTRIANLEGQAIVKSQIGWLHFCDNDYHTARQLFTESEGILENHGKRSDFHQHVLANLVRTHIALEQGSEAKAWLEKIAFLEARDGVKLPEIFTHYLNAQVEALMGNHKKAKEHCTHALNLARQRSDASSIIDCQLILADIAKHHDSLEQRALLENALMLAEDSNDIINMMKIHQLLSSHYKLMGNATSALHHLEEFYELQRKQQREQSQRTIENLRIINELNVYKLQAEMKESDNKRLQEQLEEKTQELSVFAMRILERQEFLAELERGLRLLLKANPAEVHERVYELIKHVKSANTGERDWQDFRSQFLHMHEDFIAALQQINPDLSPSELKVMALVRMRMSTKQIAEILHLSPRSVENHRNHVRKKLKLGPAQNLVGYLSSI